MSVSYTQSISMASPKNADTGAAFDELKPLAPVPDQGLLDQ